MAKRRQIGDGLTDSQRSRNDHAEQVVAIAALSEMLISERIRPGWEESHPGEVYDYSLVPWTEIHQLSGGTIGIQTMRNFFGYGRRRTRNPTSHTLSRVVEMTGCPDMKTVLRNMLSDLKST